MSQEMINVETHGRVGLITINRPKAMNALNDQVMDEIGAALDAFEADENIGAMVITGSEKAFAAGADIKEMSVKSYADMVSEQFFARWDGLASLRTPTIAAVTGYALGGGCELAMLCDILGALGEEASPASPAYGLFRRAVARLCRRRVTLCVDEAHHMGPRCLSTIKGLINATPGEFVLAGQPTLWRALQDPTHLELRQLITNRLRERIQIGMNLGDVAAYIAEAFPALDREAAHAAARAVAERARNLGNMSFVRDCCAAAARKAEDPTRPEQGDWSKAAEATAARK